MTSTCNLYLHNYIFTNYFTILIKIILFMHNTIYFTIFCHISESFLFLLLIVHLHLQYILQLLGSDIIIWCSITRCIIDRRGVTRWSVIQIIQLLKVDNAMCFGFLIGVYPSNKSIKIYNKIIEEQLLNLHIGH